MLYRQSRALELDPLPPSALPELPDQWTAEHVLTRFSEGLGVLLRMPAGRLKPAGFTTSWPQYADDWDLLLSRGGEELERLANEGRLDPEFAAGWADLRERKNAVRLQPSAAEITLLERVIDWPLQFLRERPLDAFAFGAVALARAREVELRAVLRGRRRRSRRSVASWHQLGIEAAEFIAVALRANGTELF